MLAALILSVLVVIGVVLVLLGVVVVGIRQEPPWTKLSEVAPSPIAVVVRRLLGLYVRRPTPTADNTDRRQERLPDTPATRTRATT
jgi:hypothetical protein